MTITEISDFEATLLGYYRFNKMPRYMSFAFLKFRNIKNLNINQMEIKRKMYGIISMGWKIM